MSENVADVILRSFDFNYVLTYDMNRYDDTLSSQSKESIGSMGSGSPPIASLVSTYVHLYLRIV
jgi:hypothetical protein